MKLTTIVAEVKAKWLNPFLEEDNCLNSHIEQTFKLIYNSRYYSEFKIGCKEFNRNSFLKQAKRRGIWGEYSNIYNQEAILLHKHLQLEEFEKVVNWVAELPPMHTEIPRIQHQKQLTLFLKNHNRRI